MENKTILSLVSIHINFIIISDRIRNYCDSFKKTISLVTNKSHYSYRDTNRSFLLVIFFDTWVSF